MARMPETLATFGVDLLLAYFALGAAFAFLFLARGVGQIDPVARQSSLGFKTIVFPGVVALWPVLLKSWLRKARPA